MKIRMGFVSNSSSSSFLIIYKSLEDFKNFILFKGYEIFEKDLIKNQLKSSMSGFDHIQRLIEEALYRVFLSYKEFNQSDITYPTDKVWDLFEFAGVPFKEFEVYEMKVRDLGAKFIKTIDEKFPGLTHILFNSENYYMILEGEEQDFVNKEQDKLWNEYEDEAFQKEMEDGCKLLAKRIEEALKAKGYNIRSIRYEDETSEGAYMENGFMPFLQKNPDRDYEIFVTNEH